MGITISCVNLWVDDQDAALAFWTGKVGFELRSDWTFPEMPGFRWLTVGPRDQPDVEVVLMAIPGTPVVTEQQRTLVQTVVSTGLAGALFLATDDLQRDYEAMLAQGVEFTETPSVARSASTAASATRRATRSASPR